MEALPHREKLLREGTRRLYSHGFHGTTVDGILAATGVPKGSFYHHFGSKEALAKEALRRYLTFQLDLLESWTAKADLPTADVLVGYFTDMAEAFTRSEYQRACLFGKLSAEMSAGSPEFRAVLADHVKEWQVPLRELLRARARTRATSAAGSPSSSWRTRCWPWCKACSCSRWRCGTRRCSTPPAPRCVCSWKTLSRLPEVVSVTP
ncbi:TetR/AcrR family transcriptional regulator [Kutzneria sp. 744]|uniref:TetR/AcrR family transcriptional regulator n=1 Tax=Kutzneria sp. (strain 744) TaxID=345341 RepID=UPI0003EEAA2C|nr:TetR/AcrR family transcriptional regulator [Kutzneria sp. 744]EWM10811.1 transcriptional regulator, TetR family [Kutzneria sp. 744]